MKHNSVFINSSRVYRAINNKIKAPKLTYSIKYLNHVLCIWSGHTLLFPSLQCSANIHGSSTRLALKHNKVNATYMLFILERIKRDHPFKTSACLRGGGVSPCADGQKVTVHKDQKSPS